MKKPNKGHENIKGQGFHTHPERINLKGRPKSAKMPDLKEALALALSEEKDGITALEVVITKLRQKAMKGDIRAIQELLDRAFGKATQVMEVALEQKKPDWLNYLEAEEAKDVSEESNQTEDNE